MLRAINGMSCLGLFLWSDLAINSLPVPDSPWIRTVAIVVDNFPIALKTFCIAWDSPMMSSLVSVFKPFVFGLSSSALFIISVASSKSNGFGKYSNAPPPKDSTAACMSAKAVIIITGISS